MSGAVFEVDGEVCVPTPIARAGWYEDALHGGPVAALFARAVERVPAVVEMTVIRLTVDIMRPVPTRPMRVATRVVRDGRRIQVVEASLLVDDDEMARASALRIRSKEVSVPEHPSLPVPPDPEGLVPYRIRQEDGEWFHSRAVEARFVAGDFYETGPATVWMRLMRPLFAGEEPSPLQRVAALSDFGNGMSRVVPWTWLFINGDLSVHLLRPAVGEWVCLDSRTDLAGGIGLAQSRLFDHQGLVGHALQGLLIEAPKEADTAG